MNKNRKKYNINFGLQNVRSINNKESEISELITEMKFDILCLTETWLTGTPVDIPSITACLPYNYSFFHEPRISARGGGVGAIISNDIGNVNVVNSEKSFKSFEKLELLITVMNKTLKLIIVYRTPSIPISLFLSEFYNYVDDISFKEDLTIISGDFNIHINECHLSTTKQFQCILENFSLKNHKMVPTHNAGNILDLVISDDLNNFIENVIVHNTLKMSDHSLITFKLNYETQSNDVLRKIEYRDMSSINTLQFADNINHIFKNLNWKNGPSYLFEIYNSILKNTLDIHSPLKIKYCRRREKEKYQSWLDKEIFQKRKLRRKMERNYRRYRSESCKRRYILARNNVVQLIKKKKTDYYRKKLQECNGNSQIIFRILDKLLGNSNVNQKFENNFRKANDFATFFKSKIQKINEEIEIKRKNLNFCKIGSVDLNLNFQSRFTFRLVSFDLIRKLIYESKSTTCQYDPIPTDLLKDNNIMDKILSPITNLINCSLNLCVFPEGEKCAIVRPLLKVKSGDFNTLSNYRPISNLSFISKILEKVVSIQLMTYLEENSILSDFQSAYRSLHSTETALLKINNDIMDYISKDKCVIMILLDLSAAFDTVNHKILLTDLQTIGICGEPLNWFKSYLVGRKQVINIEDSISCVNEINCGVPQGSVLGPILFLIYTSTIKNIFDKHGFHYHLYADDTQVYASFDPETGKEIILKADKLLHEINHWMTSRYLKLNENKTEVIVFGSQLNLKKSKLKDLNFQINNVKIEIRESVKNIGFLFDNTMKMNSQINNIVKTCNMQIRRVNKIRKYITREAATMLLHAVISSRLDFHNSLLYNIPEFYLNRLQLILNKSVRIIFNLRRRDRITEYMIKLHWLPINARIEFKILLLIQKTLIYKKPTYLHNLLSYREPSQYMDLRRNNDQGFLTIEYPQNCKEERIFKMYAAKLYNSLPESVRNIKSIDVYKDRLKTFLFRKFYNDKL